MTEATEVLQKDGLGTDAAEMPAERFDLATVDQPTRAMQVAEELVTAMADRCTGPQYVAEIQGKRFPKVEWWTTVGASLGLFPVEESCERMDREDEVAYEATVGVYNGNQRVTRASAICSEKERTWEGRDEYAIRSMAITRATGKAYRLGLSFLAVMSGLEATPAEEMPQSGESDDRPWSPDQQVGFGKHADLTYRSLIEEDPDYAEWLQGADRPPEEAKAWLRETLTGSDSKAQQAERRKARNRFWMEIQNWIEDADAVKEFGRLMVEWYADKNESVPDDGADWGAAHFDEARRWLEEYGEDGVVQVQKWALRRERDDA